MWKLKADERLSAWRDFRKTIGSKPLNEAVDDVATFWARCPFTPYYLDPDLPLQWPDPWTLIEENYYCDLAKALGMLYTIKFTAHSPPVELRTYQDPKTKSYYNLVWVDDGKYILNMNDGEVLNNTHSEIKLNLNLKRIYKEAELKLSSY